MEKCYIHGNYNKKNWDDFIQKNVDSIDAIHIAKGKVSNKDCYSDMSVYTMRFYNRCLNSNEVSDNYDRTLAYRKLMKED